MLAVACPALGEEDCETGLFPRTVKHSSEFHVLACRNPLSDVFRTKAPRLPLITFAACIYVPGQKMPPPHFEVWDRKILMSSYGVYGMFVYMVYWKCKFSSKSYAYSNYPHPFIWVMSWLMNVYLKSQYRNMCRVLRLSQLLIKHRVLCSTNWECIVHFVFSSFLLVCNCIQLFECVLSQHKWIL